MKVNRVNGCGKAAERFILQTIVIQIVVLLILLIFSINDISPLARNKTLDIIEMIKGFLLFFYG